MEIMEKAYVMLKKGNRFPLSPSHLYVRFLPKNEHELYKLEVQEGLELFSYPLDYEILTPGNYYHDPTLPDSQITWQYTVVDVNYQFPANIKYEILDSVLIPTDENVANKIGYSFAEQLEAKAYELIGENVEETPTTDEGGKTSAINAKKWNPSGRVLAYDNIVQGFIPVEGVKVRARRFLKIGVAYTSSSGSFHINKKFKGPVRYSIKFSRPKFRIKYKLSTAIILGPKQKGSYDFYLSITREKHLAAMHRAAYRYFHKNIAGLTRPIAHPAGLFKRIILKYKEGNNPNAAGYFNMFLYCVRGALIIDLYGFPSITIYSQSKNNDGSISNKKVNEILQTTIHEFAHLTHFQIWATKNPINIPNIVIGESWADAVEWKVSQLTYKELGISCYGEPDPTQFPNPLAVCSGSESIYLHKQEKWNINSINKYPKHYKTYTLLFIDIVDNYNQAVREQLAQSTNPDCPQGSFYDGANCFITPIPNGVKNIYARYNRFEYDPPCVIPGSKYYYLFIIGLAKCGLFYSHPDAIGFIWNNALYYRPLGSNEYPRDWIQFKDLAFIEKNILPYVSNVKKLHQKLKSYYPPNPLQQKELDIYFKFYYNLNIN